mgnify:CR=1 FL=1
MLIEDFIKTSIFVEFSRVGDLERKPQQDLLARRLAHVGIFSWENGLRIRPIYYMGGVEINSKIFNGAKAYDLLRND